MVITRQSTGFFDLPSEIRNHIYGLVFPCADNTAYDPVSRSRRVGQCQCFGQQLAEVSHQMRTEALVLFYSVHAFHFSMFLHNKPILETWVNDIAGDWIHSVRRFQLKGYYQVRVVHWLSIFGETTVELDGPDAVVTSQYYEHEAFNAKVVDEANDRIAEIAQSLPCVDGKRTLTREKLLEMFDTLGFH